MPELTETFCKHGPNYSEKCRNVICFLEKTYCHKQFSQWKISYTTVSNNNNNITDVLFHIIASG